MRERRFARQPRLLVSAQAGFKQRGQVIAYDHARRMIDGLELRIDCGKPGADAFECRLQHVERGTVAFDGAPGAGEGQCRLVWIGKALERMHARHARARRGRGCEIARGQRAAAVKHDVAAPQQPALRKLFAAMNDPRVRWRQHPDVGRPHFLQPAHGVAVADERHCRTRAVRRAVEHVLDDERMLRVPQRTERAADAAAADDVERFLNLGPHDFRTSLRLLLRTEPMVVSAHGSASAL